ncbi:MAG: hypothetical protein JW724_07175 [Candidatus Altiarchaeota archaeon]|nr:hypothetical protein [Candidatus Altiarchaeota archaeon]
MRIYGPAGILIKKETDKTSASGSAYLHFPGFSEVGEYSVELEYNGATVDETYFDVLSPGVEVCINCKPKATTTTASSGPTIQATLTATTSTASTSHTQTPTPTTQTTQTTETYQLDNEPRTEIKPVKDDPPQTPEETDDITEDLKTAGNEITNAKTVQGLEWKTMYLVNLSTTQDKKGHTTLTSTAEGNSLYSCKDWDQNEKRCRTLWRKEKDLKPGEPYEITPEDELIVLAEALNKYSLDTKSKKDYTAEENPNLNAKLQNETGETIDSPMDATLRQPHGPRNLTAEEINRNPDGTHNIKLKKERAFRPGKYILHLNTSYEGVAYEEDIEFLWGVLAVNTHKSIYLPGETAEIGMAVLDNTGHMVCDANATLTITSPTSDTTILSTADGTIKVSEECTVYGVTNLPDYYTQYTTTDPGTYQINLTAKTRDGTNSITSNFTVQDSVDYDVARYGPTRIYPPAKYAMAFTIKVGKEYEGEITEVVPAGFDITPQEGMTITEKEDTKKITWQKTLTEGETTTLSYEFDAPDISPYLYILGPASIGDFQEKRQWMIASDAAGISGMAAYQLSAQASTPALMNWTGSTWSAKIDANAVSGTVQWTVLRENPARTEKILVTLDSENDVIAQVWNGTSWTSQTMTDNANLNTKKAFAANVMKSGKVMVAYNNNTAGMLAYRIWDGTSWSSQTGVTLGGSAQIEWVEIAASNNSDRLMLVAQTASTSSYPDLYARPWNGTNWRDPQTLETDTENTAYQNFDVAFESNSDEVLVVYSQQDLDTVMYRTYGFAGAGSWSGEGAAYDSSNGDLASFRLAAYPGTDRIMACCLETDNSDLDCQEWDGGSWQTGARLDGSVEVYSGTRNFDVAPNLATGGFLVIYGDSNDNFFEFYQCTSQANCQGGTWAGDTPAGSVNLGSNTAWGQVYPAYNVPGTFVALMLDQTGSSGWWKARASCDSSTCTWLEAPNSLGQVSSTAYESAYFTFDIYEPPKQDSLAIFDETDAGAYGGMTKYPSEPVTFYANYTNATGYPMNSTIAPDASCSITIYNVSYWTGPVPMEYNAEKKLFQYNMTGGLSAAGTYNWNVTCNASGYLGNRTNNTVTLKSLRQMIYNFTQNVTRNRPGTTHLWNLSGYVNNTGSSTQTNVWLNWTLPAGWTNVSGSLSKYIASQPQGEINWSNISANISMATELGEKTITLWAYSDLESVGESVTMYVYADTNLTGLSSNDTEPSRSDMITLTARLFYDNGSYIAGKNVSFYDQTYGIALGNATSNETGWAALQYPVPEGAAVGAHTFNATHNGTAAEFLNPSGCYLTVNVHDVPLIQNVSATPQTMGYNTNVSIRANVTDLENVSSVYVNISYPNGSSIFLSMANYTADLWEHNFSDTGQVGDYSYWIWANDSAGKENRSGSYAFYVRSNVSVGVATALDSYGAKEDVNLTRYPTWLTGWTYRKEIELTEPGVSDRINWPVDVRVETSSHTDNCTREFRVTDEYGVNLTYMVYNETYATGKCVAANVVFLANISESQNKKYYVYYGNPSASEQTFPIWSDSCTSSQNSSVCASRYYSRHVLPQGLDSYTYNTNLGLGNDDTVERALPWTFVYFNTTHSSVYVDSNGYLAFAAYASDDDPTQAEFLTRKMIAALWDNIRPDYYGGVYEDAYSDKVVYTYNTVNRDSEFVIFQAVLYETGDIMLRYDQIDGYRETVHIAGISMNDSANWFNNTHASIDHTAFYQYSRAGQTTLGAEEEYGNISRICNRGPGDLPAYILMRLQSYSGGSWTNLGLPVVDDVATGTPRNVPENGSLNLDPIWAAGGGWNTGTYSSGTYRVLVQLKDAAGTILIDSSGNPLEAAYSFEIINASLSLKNITYENSYTYGVNEYETGDNIAWINITASSNNSIAVDANITLNIRYSGSSVAWGPNQTLLCGDVAAYGMCTKRFDNNSYGYTIPTDASAGSYAYVWNVTMGWTNGGSTENNSLNFSVHRMTDNMSSVMTPGQVNKGYNTTYNVTITNPWFGRNLTGVNVSINCPDVAGLSCVCRNMTGSTCNLMQMINLMSYVVSFNVTTSESTPIGDYGINVTVNYTNPGGEFHSWAGFLPQTLMVRQAGIDAVIYNYSQNMTRNGPWEISGYVNDTDAATQTNVRLNWTLPSGWTNISGSLSKYIASLPYQTANWSNLTANIPLQAELGPQTLSLRADSDQGSDWQDMTVYVYANTSASGFASNDSDPSRESYIRLKAQLLYDNGSCVSGETVYFFDQTSGASMGSAATNLTGWTVLNYKIPSGAPVGVHTLNASYPGSVSGYRNPAVSTTTISVHDIPLIKDVSASPQMAGYGFNVSLTANVTDVEGVGKAYVNITYPNGSSVILPMENHSASIFEYNFSDTWQIGTYAFYVWANDTVGKSNWTSTYYFNISARAWARVATAQDAYTTGTDVYLARPSKVWWNTTWQYRQGVNVTEPGVGERTNWPVDVNIDTGSHATNCTKEFRVVDNDSNMIPFRVYNETYAGGKCTSANVVFLVNASQSQTNSYWIYYGNLQASAESFGIWSDYCPDTMNATECSTTYYSRKVLPAGTDTWNTSTRLVRGDDGRATATLQWSFRYFNQSFTSGYAVTNGFLDFGNLGTEPTNSLSVLKTNALIAPVWDDLNCQYSGGEGVYQNDHAGRTVFTWDCSLATDNGNDMLAQAVLYSGGDIMIRYGTFDDYSMFSPTVGISGGDNLTYLQNPWGSNEVTAFYQYSGSRALSTGSEESVWGSQITNLGSTDISGYLLMAVQRNDSGAWTEVSTVVSDASPRAINQSRDLNLSSIWDEAGGWNTDDMLDGRYRVYVELRSPQNATLENDDGTSISAYYVFNVTGQPPTVRNVSASPQTIGFGGNVTLSANVTDNGVLSKIFLNLTYPNGTSAWMEMTSHASDNYSYNFTDTWQRGTYSYRIWANDSTGNADTSDTYYFYVKANLSLTLRTQFDSYADNQNVNLMDSWANDTGSTASNAYLYMWVQRNDSTQWTNISTVVANQLNAIDAGGNLNLSKIWLDAGAWNTGIRTKATYRVYAELRDIANRTLQNDTGGYSAGWYEFEIAPPVMANITRITIYNVTDSADRHGDTTNLVDFGLNKTFGFYQNEIYRIGITVNNSNHSSSDWTLSDTTIAVHNNLDPDWTVANLTDVWYSNGSVNWSGGNFTGGNVTWNTTSGATIPVNGSVTFCYILDLTGSPTELKQVVFVMQDSSFSTSDYSAFKIMDSAPPGLFNEIYNLTSTAITRGGTIGVYARWAETIGSALVEYNSSDSSLANHTATLPEPNPGNWTNHTVQTNSTWLRGGHMIRILADDSFNNWNTSLPYLNFTVWSGAEVASSLLDPDRISQGASATMKCLVRENDTLNPIGGYTVSFYNSTSFLGTAVTNATGWAVHEFSDYSIGEENITCNITDWSAEYYNATAAKWKKNVLFTTETNPPWYSNVSPQNNTNVYKNDSTVLQANWSEDVGLNKSWLATNETGTWENKSGTYGSPAILYGTTYWSNYTWTKTTFTPGKFSWRIYANDTSGNVNETPVYTLIVWGWAEIDDSFLDPSTISPGGSTNFSCHVRDANSLSSVANYTVYFYNSTGFMGTNLTNSSGWATYNFTMAAQGTHNITCTIGDQASIYYNKTANNASSRDLVAGSPPGIWSGTYGVTPASVNKGQNLTLYARWDKNISAAYASFNSTSPTINEYPVTLPDPNPQNWTNYTIQTNGNWLVGGHSAKLRANNTQGAWNNTLDYLTFTVWGKSKIEWNSPTGSISGNSVVLKCNATDNLSEEGIPDYPVYFYNNSWEYIGSSTTDSSGVASLNLDIGDYPLGAQTFTCRIMDAATLYYMRSGDYQTSEVLTLLGTLNVTIDSPTNGSAYHRGDTVSLLSTTRDQNGQTATPDTATWHNSTNYSIGSGEDTTWVIGATYELGPERIIVNASKTNYEPDSENVTIDIWGYANVSWVSPAAAQQYTQGTTFDLVCRVTDMNTSQGIENYTVYFYHNDSGDSYLGSNATNSTGQAVYAWNTSGYGVDWYNARCNITDSPQGYYNVSDANYANSTINITQAGYLEVGLSLPCDNTTIGANRTFVVNATVTCRGTNCGNVEATARYNTTSQQPDTEMQTCPDSPFCIVSGTEQAICGTLDRDQTCVVNYTINATGTLDTWYDVGVKFLSQYAGTALTEGASVKTSIVLILTVDPSFIDWEVQEPGQNCTPGEETPKSVKIKLDANSNDAGGVYIKGTDLVNASNSIGIGNVTWCDDCGMCANGANMGYEWQQVRGTTLSGTNISTDYWLDIPAVHFGRYGGELYVKANVSY